jgi:hypothetical protein
LDLPLNANAQTAWHFATADEILLPANAPTQVQLKLWADGYSEARTLLLPLKAHVNPVAGGAYLFPGEGERPSGRGVLVRRQRHP